MALNFAPPFARTSRALSDISRIIHNIGENRLRRQEIERQHERALQEIELTRTDIESRARLGDIRLRGELSERAERRSAEERRFGEQQLTGKATREVARITGEAAERRGEREVFQLETLQHERRRGDEEVSVFEELFGEGFRPEEREEFLLEFDRTTQLQLGRTVERRNLPQVLKLIGEKALEETPAMKLLFEEQQVQKDAIPLLELFAKSNRSMADQPGIVQELRNLHPNVRVREVTVATGRVDDVTGDLIDDSILKIDFLSPQNMRDEAETAEMAELSGELEDMNIVPQLFDERFFTPQQRDDILVKVFRSQNVPDGQRPDFEESLRDAGFKGLIGAAAQRAADIVAGRETQEVSKPQEDRVLGVGDRNLTRKEERRERALATNKLAAQRVRDISSGSTGGVRPPRPLQVSVAKKGISRIVSYREPTEKERQRLMRVLESVPVGKGGIGSIEKKIIEVFDREIIEGFKRNRARTRQRKEQISRREGR